MDTPARFVQGLRGYKTPARLRGRLERTVSVPHEEAVSPEVRAIAAACLEYVNGNDAPAGFANHPAEFEAFRRIWDACRFPT